MEVEHNSSLEQNTSMEALKVDEDESNKETSLEEDILGAQSLLMSDSDEESNQNINTTNGSLPKKISPKRSKRILDSDDDEKEENPAKDESVEINSIKVNNKISALIDSDSEQDEEKTESETKLSTNVLIDKEINVDETQKIDFKQIKQGLKKKSKKTSKKISSEDQTDGKFVKKTKKKSNKTKKGTGLEDSSETSKKKSKKVTSLIDSETDESATHTENDTEGDDNEEHLKEKGKKPKAVRASAKKALDEMQAIQSEQQRLHREAHISLPYHKPKKHTLEEFLKRRTIIQPPLPTNNDCTAAKVVHGKRLKMTPEELEEYAKLMEEREKEATEFFKSESESEEEVFKDNEGVLNKLSETQQSNDNKFTSEKALSKTEAEDSPRINTAIGEEIKENLDGVQLTEEELAELLAEQNPIFEEKNNNMHERPTCSKVLITEVIELPKLDMNTVRFSPVKKPTPPRPSLNIKELLRQKNLSGSPSLSGDPNKLIDLETGNLIEKKPTGIENLMKRLMATVKHKKSKKSEICNILSVENGKLEMSKVNVSLTEAKDLQKEPKPGAAYFELQKNLKEIIKKKRLDELNKKQEDELEYNKCLADDGYDEEYVDNAEEAAQEDEEEAEDNEMEEETNENEPVIKPKNKVIVVDDEENALVVEEDEENEERFENEENIVDLNSDDEDENLDNDYEQEDVNDSEERDDEEEEDNCDDNKKTIEFTQISERKNRIIKPLNDSDDENDKDDIDFLKTQPPTTQPPLFDTQPSQKITLEDEETELIDLCSGTFDATQKTTSKAALMSQIPLTQNNGQTMNDNELIELCSGTFDEPIGESQVQTQYDTNSDKVKPKCNKILSSDDEDCDEDDQEKSTRNKGRVKKLTKRITKRKAKLGFSDDEDEEEEDEDIVDSEDCEENEVNEEELTEEPETFVDYDSEENEILVQMTKKDKVKQAQNFVENEAELSESDWGSADEDEKNLDTYDIELGDEDEFDKDKLQTELGKIHARKMLDEDIREVRKIQDLLFEDEERDGVGRQRTFRWKNAESGFSLEDGHQLEPNGENGDSGDEINEHQWRKIRFEREQFLKEHGLKPGSQDMSTVVMNTATQSVNSVVSSTTAKTTKKLQIITTKKTSVSISSSKKSSPFLISKGSGNMNKKSVRGSFLVRDKETLNKLAGITKGTASAIAGSEMDETAGTVSIKNIKPNNFVFATLTEEEHESLKRKADDLNSSGENGKNFMKKPKLEPRRDKCLIDQLL